MIFAFTESDFNKEARQFYNSVEAKGWQSEKDPSGLLLFYSNDYFAIGSRYADIYAFGKYSVENGKILLSEYDFNKNHEYCHSLFNGEKAKVIILL